MSENNQGNNNQRDSNQGNGSNNNSESRESRSPAHLMVFSRREISVVINAMRRERARIRFEREAIPTYRISTTTERSLQDHSNAIESLMEKLVKVL